MAMLQADVKVVGQDLFTSSATALNDIGTVTTDGNGNYFRYVLAGASSLVAGNAIQAPAQVTTHDQLTPAAAAVGATQVTIALDPTNAATANQYAGGFVMVDTTPGEGYSYPIISHPAIAASASGVFTLGRPIQVAWTTSSRVTLVPNRFKGVIQSPVTTQTGTCVGVAVYPITAAQYGWIGCGGEFATLIAGTPAVGAAVVVPGTAAGCVVVDGAATATEVIGSMMVTGVDGKILPVRWNFR